MFLIRKSFSEEFSSDSNKISNAVIGATTVGAVGSKLLGGGLRRGAGLGLAAGITGKLAADYVRGEDLDVDATKVGTAVGAAGGLAAGSKFAHDKLTEKSNLVRRARNLNTASIKAGKSGEQRLLRSEAKKLISKARRMPSKGKIATTLTGLTALGALAGNAVSDSVKKDK